MKNINTKDLVMCSLFTALVAVGAFIKIPVPYMDYFTLQFLFVLLAGMLLGSRLGMLSVMIYVLLGLFGFPIFASGGGINYILRPSFGYLIGFVFAAFVCGLVLEKAEEKLFKTYFISAFAGFVVTYFLGLTYKYLMLNFFVGEPVSFFIVLASCFPLDMPGVILLCFMSAVLGKKLVPIVRRNSYAVR